MAKEKWRTFENMVCRHTYRNMDSDIGSRLTDSSQDKRVQVVGKRRAGRQRLETRGNHDDDNE